MIENAQATLGGINENSQSSRVPQQAWGHEEKSNGSKNFEQNKKTNVMMLKTIRRKQKQRERAQAHN